MAARVPSERVTGTSVVFVRVSCVSVASPELLHTIVHRAALRPRNEDDWWGNPIDSALAAVALARHQRAFRDDAVRVVARLERWWSGGEMAPLSANVAALALTARARAELQQTDAVLTAAAAEGVDGLAKRDHSLSPELHLALCVWALDRLLPDRSKAPWPELRQRFGRGQGFGVDQPIRRYCAAIAAAPFDAAGLTQALLGEIGSSPSPTDSVVLVWLLTATLERVTEALPESDSGLRVLIEQRTGLVERLAGEIDEQTFVEPTIGEFDPDADEEQRSLLFLSPMEALLLDLSLATREAETPWLTFAEADSLFGAQAHEANTQLATTRASLFQRIALLGFSLSLLFGAVVALAAVDAGVAGWVAANAGLAVGAAAAFVSAISLARVRTTPVFDATGYFTGGLAVIAAIDAWNQSRAHPFLPDALGVTVALIIPLAVVVPWAIFMRPGRKRTEA
jgi:hypothetical protein